MSKDTFLSFRIEETLKERLKAMAKVEDRTLSQVCLILIREALAQRDRYVWPGKKIYTNTFRKGE